MRFSNGNVVDRRPAAQVSDTAVLRPRRQLIRISIVDSDPVRLVGFSAVFREARVQVASCDDFRAHASAAPGRSLASELWNAKSLRSPIPANICAPGFAHSGDRRRHGTRGGDLEGLVLGAKGCVDETAPAADFIKGVQVVHQGLVWAPRRVCSTFIDVFTSCTPLPVPDRSGPVTDREREVLQLLTHAKSNREIGEALAIQERTVKGHLAKVMRKTGVRNRVELSLHVINQTALA